MAELCLFVVQTADECRLITCWLIIPAFCFSDRSLHAPTLRHAPRWGTATSTTLPNQTASCSLPCCRLWCLPPDEATSILQGLSLDDVWNNIVATIGGLDAQAEETIEEQIIHREQREKLLRQIESLEKQCRTEKQTRKKYELHQQLQELKLKLKIKHV